jgi:hypothetical protein
MGSADARERNARNHRVVHTHALLNAVDGGAGQHKVHQLAQLDVVESDNRFQVVSDDRLGGVVVVVVVGLAVEATGDGVLCSGCPNRRLAKNNADAKGQSRKRVAHLGGCAGRAQSSAGRLGRCCG